MKVVLDVFRQTVTRQELPPPIPFSMKFSDQAYDITKLVKTTFQRIKKGRVTSIDDHRSLPHAKETRI